MTKRQQVLVAMPDTDDRNALVSTLAAKGLDHIFASTLQETKAILNREPVAMVFCQNKLEDGGFHDLLGVSSQLSSKIPVVVCSHSYEPSLYMDAMSQGAFDFVAYPYSPSEVEWILSCALPRAAAVGAA
jgi:DNA-binding NtrC family response regulator